MSLSYLIKDTQPSLELSSYTTHTSPLPVMARETWVMASPVLYLPTIRSNLTSKNLFCVSDNNIRCLQKQTALSGECHQLLHFILGHKARTAKVYPRQDLKNLSGFCDSCRKKTHYFQKIRMLRK